MMRSALLLLCVLVAFWFTLSGYFDHTMLLVTGSISVLLVTGLVWRMKLLDTETAPYGNLKTLGYFVWLFKEIGKANMTVVKAVLNPDMKISPSMIKVDMKQSTDLGRTIFANSITLTPGTISVELDDGEIMVHALLDEMTDATGFQEMSERAGRAINDPMLTKKPAAKTAAKIKKITRKGK